MVTNHQIEDFCRKIVQDFHPDRIILFGSCASGEQSADSDVDLLVIMPFEGGQSEQAIRILTRLNVLAPIDLLVRTPKQVQERLSMGDPFMHDIVERGKVMYEASDPRMG